MNLGVWHAGGHYHCHSHRQSCHVLPLHFQVGPPSLFPLHLPSFFPICLLRLPFVAQRLPFLLHTCPLCMPLAQAPAFPQCCLLLLPILLLQMLKLSTLYSRTHITHHPSCLSYRITAIVQSLHFEMQAEKLFCCFAGHQVQCMMR